MRTMTMVPITAATKMTSMRPTITHHSPSHNKCMPPTPNPHPEPIVEPWVPGCQTTYFTHDGLHHPMVFTDGCLLGNGQPKVKIFFM